MDPKDRYTLIEQSNSLLKQSTHIFCPGPLKLSPFVPTLSMTKFNNNNNKALLAALVEWMLHGLSKCLNGRQLEATRLNKRQLEASLGFII